MSWLLDLLVDAIKEMVSQFIIDMMELITGVFTDLLSCNLSLFEELFSVVGGLYQNVIVPMGIAILLMILVWQLFKSMFGNKLGVNAEEPIELLGRSAICLFFVVGSKPLVNYVLKIAGTPYQWVMGTEIKVQSFSEYVSAHGGDYRTSWSWNNQYCNSYADHAVCSGMELFQDVICNCRKICASWRIFIYRTPCFCNRRFQINK